MQASPVPHPSVCPPTRLRIAVVGCGMIGGSFALGVKAAGVAQQVIGFSPSAATRSKALALQVIDRAATSAAECVQGTDVVLLAAPVAAMASIFSAIAPVLSPQALVMDAGSTKLDVIAAARAHLHDKITTFVPTHPIAGKEQAGVAHSEATLYQNKRVILTPLAQNTPAQLALAKSIWQALGSEVVCMDAATHDQTFAAVSHLPHLLAFALVNSIAGQPQGADFLALAGSGFRDSTRIADSPPWVWRDILHANRQAVCVQLKSLRAELDTFESALNDPQTLDTLIRKANQIRAQMRFDSSSQQDTVSS